MSYKELCHQDIAVFGQFCAKVTLSVLTNTQNAREGGTAIYGLYRYVPGEEFG